MSIRFYLFLFVIISFQSLSGQAKLSTLDYEKAESQLRYTTSSLIDNMNVRPNWNNDDLFWYQILSKVGVEFKAYNIKERTSKSFPTELSLQKNIGSSKENPTYNRRKEVISPDGKKLVFIRDWNLWLREIESKNETQITFDGEENFGYSTDNAGWRQGEKPIVLWSPNSKKIATFKQDQRHVSDMHLVSTNVGTPELKSWKYPLPQDDKVIQIHRVIIDIEKGKIVKLNIPPDPRRGTLCDDIACSGSFDDNDWSKDGKELMFVSSSRDHKIARLRIADAETGEVREIFTEEVETQYESGRGAINWRYLDLSNEIIWYSERDNWGHLYLYNAKTGKLKSQITKGDFVVSRLKFIDEKKRRLVFEANGREEGRDPYFSHLYAIDFSGKNMNLLTPENGNHQINFSPGNKYFVDNYSQPDVAPMSVLRDIEGNLIATLEKTDISRLEATGWKPPQQIKVKSDDGKYDLYGLMFTPSNLDESKKYPIINYIYPGPQSGSVGSRSFNPARRDNQALAELGFVVISIDGTCNPYRSKAFHDECYGDMSVNTLPDQVSAMEQLAEKYTFIDLNKVGIWGHSGGGFATAAAMFRYPDFFDVGISESGNHDNRNYEDDWGERYIGLLVEKDGKSNYEHQANQNYAANLKGKLLLAHGGMDDNVPPYNTNLVIDALIKANKDFDLIMFPNARHGYGGDSLYMMRRRWDYFVKHLLNKEPPKEYKISIKSDPRLTKV
jgi:dipeptidyl aminopeptidase/acylaminoacyl peptidase